MTTTFVYHRVFILLYTQLRILSLHFGIHFIAGKFDHFTDGTIKAMIDRISCGVDLGKWDKDFLNLAIKYPECRDGDVYEEYKDNLFINVCNL